MGTQVRFDVTPAKAFVSEAEISMMKTLAECAKEELLGRKGAGNDYLGWIDLPVEYDKEEFARIQAAAQKIRKDSEVLIVIGIGGSYLGARAAIDFCGYNFPYSVNKEVRKGAPEIYYVGNSLSSTYLSQLMAVVGDRDFSVNVISKSGTTTEPAVAFRLFKQKLEEKYGEKAAERIYATTDKEKGALKNLATQKGYETFVVPDDVGGRFSVLTPVGLLPIAVSGVDIQKLMEGAASMRKECLERPYETNDSLQYAALRQIFRNKGKKIEILANYEPSFHYTGEWWKQLCGESEGKDHKGLFPAAVDLTTDLHSMGQYMQDGERILLETVVEIETPKEEISIPTEANDMDGLNYLAGKTVDYVNKKAMQGTVLAHTDGGVPNFYVRVPEQNEFYLGQLFYFFEFAIACSGYLMAINPFDQEGVESYKRNMFALLGKPGYEALAEELKKRV